MFNYETVPLYWANRLSFLTRRHLNAAFSKAGFKVVAEEWAVLLLLWRDEEQSPSALADATIRDRTTMTRLLDGMVKKGIVQREMAKDDRRRIVVRLTDHGGALRGELVPIAQAMIAQASAGLDAAQIEHAAQTLRKMTENLIAPDIRGKDDDV